MSLFHDVFTYFTSYCRVPICWFWAGKCLLGAHVTNLIYPRAEWRHRSTVFIFNFEHISHLVLVLLLLILSMYLIAGLIFHISVVFRLRWILVYSFLERTSTKWNTNSLASPSKQVFITNFNTPSFNANCNVTYFFIFFIFW